MTADRWEQQPGGLYLAVSPFDKTKPEHRGAAESVMRSTVQTVAQVHGASFSERDFRNNRQALYLGDIRLDLLLAKWEVFNRKPICLGASLSWDTLGFDPYGKIGRAVYTEDVCILSNKLRQLIREKPEGKDFPEESLLECFERISLQNIRTNDGVLYKFGEVNPDNLRMIRPLENNGGYFGKGRDSAVLEFKSLPNNLLDMFPMDAKVIALRKDGLMDENNFIVRWKDGDHDIRFIVTKGRATAIGQPRADIRSWHNGNLPEQGILECAIAGMLLAAKNESEGRGWGAQRGQNIPSPAIPLLGSRPEIYAALYGACGNEIAISAAERPAAFGKPMPDAHVYVINDQRMLDAFVTVGAAPRLFGNKPMIPGVNILRNKIGLVA